jgi:general secretion pathway protein D
MTEEQSPAMNFRFRTPLGRSRASCPPRHSGMLPVVLTVALAVLLSGCVTPSGPVVQRNPDVVTIQRAPDGDVANPDTVGTGNGGDVPHSNRAIISPGTGQVINARAASAPPPQLGKTGEATFNFEGESLHAVVKAILGDLLQQNYVIAPGVQGTVTIATPKPVNDAQALSLLEMVLGWNNARLIWSDGRYNIVPSDQAVPGNLAPRTGPPANARGFEVRAVPLKYISASEMEKLIKPYARTNAIVQVDNSRNIIVLAGTRAELQNYLRTVEIFDVDWLAGMSVGVFPLQSADAVKVVSELDKMFGEGSKTPLAGMFRFMPLEGQNAVMAITTQPDYLKRIEGFIADMDVGGEGTRLYVYEVKYVKAADLADQLGKVYGNTSSTTTTGPSMMPGLEPVEVRTTDMPPADAPLPTNAAPAGPGVSNQTLDIGGGEVGISAVEESNSLLVRASPTQWESIHHAIERLDTMPLQVQVEAQVVEVKLTGELKYGVSWFFGNAVPTANQPATNAATDWHNTAAAILGAGSAFTFTGPSAQAIINALDTYSDLHILSAPSVLVRNNVEADFNSGQQIPVASTILNNNGNTNTDNTYSQVQFRQTGVSLKVKPRISSNGMVFMEITQDVSSPSQDGPVIGGNVSVDNNKLHTEVAVMSGETIAIAGLIKTTQGNGANGFPGLSRLPVVGALFGQKSSTDDRQEILVLITPTVVRDPLEARRMTDEYGERFRGLEPLRKKQGAQ